MQRTGYWSVQVREWAFWKVSCWSSWGLTWIESPGRIIPCRSFIWAVDLYLLYQAAVHFKRRYLWGSWFPAVRNCLANLFSPHKLFLYLLGVECMNPCLTLWKFEVVDFDTTLDNSYSTSCSIEIIPVLNHVLINKLACHQRRGFPAAPCSLRPSAWKCHSDLHRAPLELSWVTQQLISLKLHLLVVCPSCYSARNWCSLQSQDYLEKNQEGFKLQVSCWWLQAGLFEFCFASTANKQFGVRRGKSERNHYFHPLSWVSLAEGWYPPLMHQAEKEAGNPSSWAPPTGWRCSPSTADLMCEMSAFPARDFHSLSWAKLQSTALWLQDPGMAVARRGWGDRDRLRFLHTNKNPVTTFWKAQSPKRSCLQKKFVNLGCCNRKSILGKKLELSNQCWSMADAPKRLSGWWW